MQTLNIYINETDETNSIKKWGVTSLANVLHLLTVDDDRQKSHYIILNIQDRKPKAISAGYRYTCYVIQLIMTLATAMYFYNRFSSDFAENEEDNSSKNSI